MAGHRARAHLLPHPLFYDVVAKDDDTGASDEPEGVEAEEGVVEAALFRVVLEGEEGGIDEHQPADHPHDDQTIAEHRIV